MFLFEVKRLIWSALEIEFFELYFLQPVLVGLPVLSGHLAIPRGFDFMLFLKRCFSKGYLGGRVTGAKWRGGEMTVKHLKLTLLPG